MRFTPVIALLFLECASAWARPPPTFDAHATCRREQALMDSLKPTIKVASVTNPMLATR